MWYSVPAQALMPGADAMFGTMNRALALVRPPLTASATSERVIQSMKRRADALSRALGRIEAAVDSLLSLAEFLGKSHVYVIDSPPGSGGLVQAILEAPQAAEAPDFGRDGIVGGIGMFATAGNVIAPLQSFWGMMGVRSGALQDQMSARAEAVQATFDDLT